MGIYTGKEVWLSSQTFSRINTQTFLKPSLSSHLPAYEDGIECSETSAYKLQTPGNYPEESIQHSEHGESLKSRRVFLFAAVLGIVLELTKFPLQLVSLSGALFMDLKQLQSN